MVVYVENKLTAKMITRYARLLTSQKHSFFLFGPRGTGKTTWLKQQFGDAKWYDLLRVSEFLRLTRHPELFRAEIAALPSQSWVVIDEVQKFPALLDEVQSIITDFGTKYRFALSGSSSRKLKRLDVNLLAGRALNRQMFPFTAAELDFHFELGFLLRFGLLPAVTVDPELAVDILEAYVHNYIREEIQQEALTKDLEGFSRFLEIASLMNGQALNISNIARDAAIQRPTARRYFEILVDTLIGVWVPAWRPRAKVKEVAHPKFYLFDPGVVRALAGRSREPLESNEVGALLETLVLHELRAHSSYNNLGGTISYWRTPSQTEVDFIWSRGNRSIGFEVKSATKWRREYASSLNELVEEKILAEGYVVYRGKELVKERNVLGLPYESFVRRLSGGEIIR